MDAALPRHRRPGRRPAGGRPVSPGVAVGMLLLAALFWGAGNVANKTLLADIGPLTALALRTLIAAAILGPLLRLEPGAAGEPSAGIADWWKSALTVAALFVLAAMLQQIAYQWTTVTNASFLVNTCTVMTPVLGWILLRQHTGQSVIAAAAMTLVGAWLMSGTPTGLQAVNAGDAACLASALFYAGCATALGRHAVRHGRPLALTLVQFAVAFAILAPAAAALEAPTLRGIAAASPEILFLAVFSTAGACVLTSVAQRRIPAPVAVVVLSLESVFGTAGAVLVLGEGVSAVAQSGGAMILGAVVVAVLGTRAEVAGRRVTAASPA